MIRLINDWDILNRRKTWNWECFHIIEVYVERDNVCRTLDGRLALLGLGVAVSIELPDRFFPENGTRDRTFEIADAASAPSGGEGGGGRGGEEDE